MAGYGFNNRAGAMNEMPRRGGMGLGLGQPRERYETTQYEPGDRDAVLDASPEMDENSDYGPPGDFVSDEPEIGDNVAGNAWADVDETDFMSWLRTQPTDMTKFLLDTYRKRETGVQEEEMPEDRYGI